VSRPQPFSSAGAQLDITYAPADSLVRQLADPQVLAVLGFGTGATVPDDPRWLQVPLQPLGEGAPLIEVWRAGAPVSHGRDDGVAWASDGQLLFGALEIDEAEGGIEAAARAAYARLTAFLARGDQPHLLRIWNYLDAIIAGEGDEERYRRFCIGRVAGMGKYDPARLPAATAIGRCDGVRRLQVYWLASRRPGIPLENPRQVSAYRYPRQYGPQSPSFARAMLPAEGDALPLLISGTAAIVGHASRHADSLPAQLEETFANLDSLVEVARRLRPQLPASFGHDTLLKVYLRDREAAPLVRGLLRDRLGDGVPCLLLHAAVCRRELRIEIEAPHR
jgi:chorismate lyase/3-hydroxybenzoate synthase